METKLDEIINDFMLVEKSAKILSRYPTIFYKGYAKGIGAAIRILKMLKDGTLDEQSKQRPAQYSDEALYEVLKKARK